MTTNSQASHNTRTSSSPTQTTSIAPAQLERQWSRLGVTNYSHTNEGPGLPVKKQSFYSFGSHRSVPYVGSAHFNSYKGDPQPSRPAYTTYNEPQVVAQSEHPTYNEPQEVAQSARPTCNEPQELAPTAGSKTAKRSSD